MSVHEILVRVVYGQIPLINAQTDESSKARGLKFGLCLRLYPHCVYASSEGPGESAHMPRRLA